MIQETAGRADRRASEEEITVKEYIFYLAVKSVIGNIR
jgi:hypothetical protein